MRYALDHRASVGPVASQSEYGPSHELAFLYANVERTKAAALVP